MGGASCSKPCTPRTLKRGTGSKGAKISNDSPGPSVATVSMIASKGSSPRARIGRTSSVAMSYISHLFSVRGGTGRCSTLPRYHARLADLDLPDLRPFLQVVPGALTGVLSQELVVERFGIVIVNEVDRLVGGELIESGEDGGMSLAWWHLPHIQPNVLLCLFHSVSSFY